MIQIDPDTVDVIRLAGYVATRPDKHSTRAHIRKALTYYWEMVGREDGPRGAVRVPPDPYRLCRALPEATAAALLDVSQGWYPHGLVVRVMLRLALRRVETAALHTSNYTDGWYTVTGKGSITATLPVHSSLQSEFTTRDDGWVFPGRFEGTHINPNAIGKWVAEVGDRIGLDHLTPHVLRHTAIASIHDATADLRLAQTYARHKDPNTTALYTRTTTEGLTAAVEALNYES